MDVLSSMTGFGSAHGTADWGSWSVEARSVNGRGLDVRVSTPPGFDALEPVIRQAAKSRFSRGSLQVSVRIDAASAQPNVEVNEAALQKLIDVFQRIPVRFGLRSRNSLATLMTINGVVTARGGPDLRALAAQATVIETLSSGVEAALDALQSARADEGRSVVDVLAGLLDEMRSSAAMAQEAAQSAPGDLKARLVERLAELGGLEGLAEGRLEAEAALLASRSDVREELDRLGAHFDHAAALISGASPMGRKLDFLSQEIGREANTLCSKSASLELTNAGLALKTLNDQFKEQVANVE